MKFLLVQGLVYHTEWWEFKYIHSSMKEENVSLQPKQSHFEHSKKDAVKRLTVKLSRSQKYDLLFCCLHMYLQIYSAS